MVHTSERASHVSKDSIVSWTTNATNTRGAHLEPLLMDRNPQGG
jgi:hypothetical protein